MGTSTSDQTLKSLSAKQDISTLQKELTAQQQQQETDMQARRIQLLKRRGSGILSNINIPTSTLG